MASSNNVANEKIVQSITEQTIGLLSTIKTDISQAKALNEEDRKNCEEICQRAEVEYNRLKKEFLEETLILINRALNTSNKNNLGQLDHVTRQCGQIANPLIDIMLMLSRNDEQNEKKYWYFFGSAMISILLLGTAIGYFIAYYHPDSFGKMIGKGTLLLGAGALAVTAIVASCTNICSQENGICSNENTQLVSARPLLNYFNGRTQNSSTSELATRMEQSIATFNITQDIWQNREALESIKKSVEVQLKNL
jgi:hypothetical protein